ncbi:MAG: alpha-L-fucosidase [Armatimonadetes bacterium]|nr:alpha-L-fucosidase [Armatimonadota bacterium]
MEALKHRADWMARGKFGMMVHWLAPGPAPEKGEWVRDLNKAVDAFNLDRFMKQFKESEADWLLFTIGQNTGYYCSPSATLDRLVGPGHASGRDLILEAARAVHAQGKRFIAYLPAEVKGQSEEIHKGFAWNPADQSEFQKRYAGFIREYAERLGKNLDGWWFDGCYTWPDFHNSLYDWPLWAGASRAGNPDAALAFNDGSFCIAITKPLSAYQDYLSGEVEVLKEGKVRLGREEDGRLILPEDRFVEGTYCQWHALAPIDCFWGHHTLGPMEPPRYSNEDLIAFVRNCHAVGGAVTLNVGIYQEGHIAEKTLAQLQKLSAAMRKG